MRTYEEECLVAERTLACLHQRHIESGWEKALDEQHVGTMPLAVPRSTWLPLDNCGVMRVTYRPEDEQNRSFEDNYN